MSWKIKEKYRELLAAENGTVIKNWGGKLSVCLVYANHYATAMSNLGFQAVYSLCNAFPDVVCERAFLPESAEMKEYEKTGTSLLSLESQRPLADFDVVAFSVSFENDYLNLPVIFELSAIPPFSSERGATFPLIIAGGAALFLNPEPVAELLDIACVGEAEAILPAFLELLRAEQGIERGELLVRASLLPGIYVPSRYTVFHDGRRVTAITAYDGAPSPVKRVWEPDLGKSLASSTLFTPGTEFSDMYLIEVSRGCSRGCRFCAAGFIYHPYRRRPLEVLMEEAERGLAVKERLGLVGAAVSDHRDLGELCRFIADRGGKVSISSLRIDALDDDLLDILHAGGHKTVALAPEGGSQRLRDLIRKGIDEDQILRACDILIGRDILESEALFHYRSPHGNHGGSGGVGRPGRKNQGAGDCRCQDKSAARLDTPLRQSVHPEAVYAFSMVRNGSSPFPGEEVLLFAACRRKAVQRENPDGKPSGVVSPGPSLPGGSAAGNPAGESPATGGVEAGRQGTRHRYRFSGFPDDTPR